MNITLYPLGSYNSGLLRPFIIELDDLDQDGYRQEISKGLFNNSTLEAANVRSICCNDCGHVAIATDATVCPECSSETLTSRYTEEEWIVCDYEDVPKQFVGEYDIDSDFWEYLETVEGSDLDTDVFEAGLDCGIELKNIEEAYSGHFDSDIDMAQELAESIGAIDENASWPMSCIDWEHAARELMYDYNESNGHYFRTM
jgi:antirestriction protein